MRNDIVLFFAFLSLLMTGCSDDNGVSYPDSDMPEIIVARNELYAAPNRQFVIEADLKDDLGLHTLDIRIPEFYLDKTISFAADTLIREYKLAYRFLVPEETQPTERYTVSLTLTDVSGNSVSKELNLLLDGDFDAPALQNVKPVDGTVLFVTEDMELNLSFDVTDVTGIDSIYVVIDKLDISETIKVGGSKEHTFNKVYPLPAELQSYEIVITTVDNFIDPNRAQYKINFSVADGLTVMYLADVPKGTDLTADIFGIPMYYHQMNDGVFTFKYYAAKDNQEVYFLGQEASFEPHCFGLSDAGILENSIDAGPVILAEKGYYEISVDTKEMTYTATKYTPSQAPYNPAKITICGNGMQQGGWDPNNTDLLLSANPENPYQLERILVLDGTDIAITITSPDWGSPWWRLDANGIIIFSGGDNANYTGATGNYRFIMDTETERAKLIRE